MNSKFGALILAMLISAFSFAQDLPNNVTSPLPLVWDNIQVKAGADGKNIITWWTLPEYHITEFIVQHSSNGYNFRAFRRVVADNPKNSFEVTDASQGNEFYRVISIDEKGNASYSKIVNIRGLGRVPLIFYDGRNTLRIQTEGKEIDELCIFDMEGRPFPVSSTLVRQGIVDITSLPRGQYNMVAFGSYGFAKKFIKL